MFPCDSLRLQGLITYVAKKSDPSAGALDADDTEGLLAGLFAEENELDRRALWRIGSWGLVAVSAVVIAVYSNQASLRLHGEQIAADDFSRQAQQVRQLARESQIETRTLASAVDTLNGDRDRLYSRVTVLEQGLDSVTGAIAKQAAGTAKPVVTSDGQPTQQNALVTSAPVVGPVATASAPVEKRAEAAKPEPQVTATVPAPASPPASQPSAAPAVTKSMMGPPDPAAPKLVEAPKQTAAVAPPASPPATSPKPEVLAAIPAEEPKDETAEEAQANVQRTEFAVDLGSANSVGGLRALWRTVVASNAALNALTPIILVRENKNGLGVQLRLAAGPLQDAATAAKICAALAGAKRGCETTVYDGQRLAMAGGEIKPLSGVHPDGRDAKPTPAKPTWTRHAKKDVPPPEPKPSGISWFGSKKP
jgi:hypothetical protein